MDDGKIPKIASLMINAHPKAKSLPQGVKVIIAQGSEEETWKKPRGYDKYVAGYWTGTNMGSQNWPKIDPKPPKSFNNR